MFLRALAAAVAVVVALGGMAGSANAAVARRAVVRADLEGVPISTHDIPRYHCDALGFPVVHCFRSSDARALSRNVILASTAGTAFVTAYDGMGYSGASVVISDNVDALFTIGWNDRISSFRARNSLRGVFYVDWYAGGASYTFCCNQIVASLGGYDNSFSSVYRR